ncbi:MAG: Ig-like domain-containing protein [Rhodoferax sp.]|nr:Ig-like domain-containing protein [Rhodoferax sp.]
MAASAYFDTVQKLYIAFYQRPADPAGLKFWAQEINAANGSLASAINFFGSQPEAEALYGNIDADTIEGVVQSIYQAAFGRDAEVEGLEYWVGEFNAGRVTPTGIAMAVVMGAANEDLATISNKLTVAKEFTAQVDGRELTDPAFGTAPFAATYSETDIDAARGLLTPVTDDAATVLTAEEITAAIKADIADEGDPIVTPVTPEVPTFTLAAGAASVAEASDATFTLTASVASDEDQTFQVVITGDNKNATVGITNADAADFEADVVETVTLAAGQTTVTFTLTPVANDGAEGFQGFKVSLLDSNFNAAATSSTVVITDVTTDTTAPVVTAAQAFSYAENQVAGAVLGTVVATDDTAVTGFAIKTGNDAGYFAIAADGKVTLTAAGAAAGVAANDFETGVNTFTLGVVGKDAAGNESAAANVVLNVTDVDDVAPQLLAATLAGTTLKLNFNEALKAGVLNASAFSVIDAANASITISSVSISGSTVTLALAAVPTGATKVSYTPPATGPVLEDAAGNDAAAIVGQIASTDVVAPTLVSASPADDATAVVAGANVALTFSENVVLGTGNITLTNAANAADTRTIAVNDAGQVSVAGAVVTVNPTADLTAGAVYYVNVPATAVLDAAGNAFAGIAGTTALNFTVAATTTTPPVDPGTPGQSFTLTAAIDNIAGTSGSDSITADNLTLSATDKVRGSAGTDTLNYTDSSAAGVTLASVDVAEVEVINIRNVNGTAAVAAVAAVSEKQEVTLTGPATATSTDFLGVSTTVVAADAASVVAGKIVANKALILAGTAAVAAGITDISNVGAVLTVTYGGANGVGNVAALTGSLSNGTSFSSGVETVTGKVAVPGTAGTGGTDTIDARVFVGATDFNSNVSSQQVDFTNLAAGQKAGLTGNGSVTTSNLGVGYAATVSAGVINVANGTKGGTITETGAGITSNTINSTGAANTLTAVVLSGTNNTALTINAAAALDVGTGITGFTGTTSTITVAGAATNVAATATVGQKGAVDLGGIQNTTVKTIDASGLTAGGLEATLSTNDAISVKGGQGNDIITTGAVLVTGTVDAGAGTADVLEITAGGTHVASSALGAKYSNFEVLRLNDSQDVSYVAGINALELNAMTDKTISKITATQAAAITVKGAQTTGVTLQLANSTGTADVVSLTLKSDVASTNVSLGNLDIAGVETLNIAALSGTAGTADAITFNTGDANMLTALNISGTADVSVVGTNIDKKVTVTSTTSGAVTFSGNLIDDSTVTTGAGKDTITAGTGFVNYTTGAGNDTINVAAAEIYAGGKYNVIAAGDGTDTLNITGGLGFSMADNSLSKITGIEKIVVAATAANAQSITTGGFFDTAFKANGVDLTTEATTGNITIDMSSFTGAAKITAKTVATGANGVIDIKTGSGNDTVTVTTAAAGTTDGTISTFDGNDTIVGGLDGEVIIGGKGTDTMTGGGTTANTFKFAAGDTGGVPSATAYDTITDFSAVASNVINAGAASIMQNTTAAAGVAKIASTGLATFNVADTTFAQHLFAVEAAINNGGTAAAGQSAMWQEGVDAFVFISDGVDGIGANDLLIKLVGVDTTNASWDTLTVGGTTFTIA